MNTIPTTNPYYKPSDRTRGETLRLVKRSNKARTASESIEPRHTFNARRAEVHAVVWLSDAPAPTKLTCVNDANVDESTVSCGKEKEKKTEKRRKYLVWQTGQQNDRQWFEEGRKRWSNIFLRLIFVFSAVVIYANRNTQTRTFCGGERVAPQNPPAH